MQKPVRQSASRQVASRRAKAHTGGRRSVATERVHGCSTPSSNRPPQSHLPVPMPARRASPRVHDHDDGDGLKTGSVLGVGGNILGIGLSHEDRGEIRTHTQHPGIGTRAKVRHNVDRQSQAWIMRARRKDGIRKRMSIPSVAADVAASKSHPTIWPTTPPRRVRKGAGGAE